jgi:hypothetical protein
MTAVSTKVPVSRTSGTGIPGGPVPVPRIVGNRRIRTGGIALATMLLALGAALSGIALVSVSKTSAYLSVKVPVSVGSQISAADLTSVQLSGGGGLTLIPATDINSVVGRHAAVSLVPGTLLSPAQLTDKALVGAGQAQIGLGVGASNLPAAHLSPGDQILLVPLGAGAAKASQPSYSATVIDVSASGSDGGLVMHVAVDADLAPTIVTLNASGGLGVVLKSGN